METGVPLERVFAVVEVVVEGSLGGVPFKARRQKTPLQPGYPLPEDGVASVKGMSVIDRSVSFFNTNQMIVAYWRHFTLDEDGATEVVLAGDVYRKVGDAIPRRKAPHSAADEHSEA
jgi:hypothetical protein